MIGKRGATWIEYTLATLLFVGLAVVMITWGRTFAQEKAADTITMASGRMDCQQIRIEAMVDNSVPGVCKATLVNRGTLNVKNVLVRYGGNQIEAGELKVAELVLQETEGLSEGVTLDENLFGYDVEFVPVVEAGKGMAGCQDKILNITCA